MHRIWRCLWNATCAAGLFSTVLVGTICVNFERGPWNGEANFQKEKEAVRQAIRNGLHKDPLWTTLLPKIMSDRGLDPDTAVDDEFAEELMKSMVGSRWQHTKMRACTTRWGSWHDGITKLLLPYYHEKLYVLLAIGLQQGWLTKASDTKSPLSDLRKRDITELGNKDDAKKESTATTAEKVAKLRDNCVNVMHATAHAMLAPTFQFDLWLINFGSGLFRAWHGAIAHGMRDADSSEKFYSDMATASTNSLFQVCFTAMTTMSDMSELAKVGFMTEIKGAADMKVIQAGEDTAEYLDQQAKADRVWMYLITVVGAFLKGFSFLWWSYPAKFASRLLISDSEARAARWDDMYKDYVAWKRVKD